MIRTPNIYFLGLFTSIRTTCKESALYGLNIKVMREMNNQLLAPFTKEEVYQTLKQMMPIKSPDLDDMNVLSYRKYWHHSWSSCYFLCSLIPDGMNHAFLTLIPKEKDSKRMLDVKLDQLVKCHLQDGVKNHSQ